MEKNKVISNLIWKFMERIGAQGVSLIVSIILARLIVPEEYGLISLITIFITISNVFIESGMGSALIQKKDSDDLDFSSVFYFNIFMSIVIYLLLFCIAPVIAQFYERQEIVLILRVFAINIIVSGFKNIQSAYVSKKMIFKKFFICTISGTIISAVIGIGMAYKGYGVWALVFQYLSNNIIGTVILWIIVDWKPKLMFSFKRLIHLISYGWKILVSGLIETVYTQLNGLVIGKVYTAKDLAYYNKGNQIPQLIMVNVSNSISSVIFPFLSQEQENKQKIKNIMKKSIRQTSYILTPMLIGLAAVAEPLVRVLLTDKWINCVEYMQILCMAYIFYPIHINNLEALKAIGKSNEYLKIEIIKKIVGISLLVVSIFISVKAMVISVLINSVISIFINSLLSKKYFNYGTLEQLKDIISPILLSSIMFLGVYMLNWININNIYIQLILKIFVGIIIYITLSFIFKIKELNGLFEIIRNYIRGKRNKHG